MYLYLQLYTFFGAPSLRVPVDGTVRTFRGDGLTGQDVIEGTSMTRERVGTLRCISWSTQLGVTSL